MNWIASENCLVLFFEVNDDDLERIKTDRDYFRDEVFVRRIQNGTGKNAHLYSITIRSGKFDIKEAIRRAVNKYDSVSWWTVKHRRFFIRRKSDV